MSSTAPLTARVRELEAALIGASEALALSEKVRKSTVIVLETLGDEVAQLREKIERLRVVEREHRLCHPCPDRWCQAHPGPERQDVDDRE